MTGILEKIKEDTERGIEKGIADLKSIVSPGQASTAEVTAPATIQSFAAPATQSAPAASLSSITATSVSNIPAIVSLRLGKLKDILNIVGTAPETFDVAADLVVEKIDPKEALDMAAKHDTLKRLLAYAKEDLTGFDRAVAMANALLVTAK